MFCIVVKRVEAHWTWTQLPLCLHIFTFVDTHILWHNIHQPYFDLVSRLFCALYSFARSMSDSSFFACMASELI